VTATETCEVPAIPLVPFFRHHKELHVALSEARATIERVRELADELEHTRQADPTGHYRGGRREAAAELRRALAPPREEGKG
jgi:hypothetical protein